MNYNTFCSLPFSKKKYVILLIPKIFKKRIWPDYLEPYGGSQWFSINGYTLKYILKFIDNHPDYLKFHRHTKIPDEIFFNSIIFSSKDPKISLKIICSNHHYIVWEIRNNKFPPATLDLNDYKNILHTDKLFCRKVDLKISQELINKIEKELLCVQPLNI